MDRKDANLKPHDITPRIELLADEVINKIAAGEVVERPASVVKELVDNAIDAGATRIDVELDAGGTKRILVRDNGKGIAADELQLACMRHATSKIRQADDLFAVQTMGFRGEALASIGSVSIFALASRPKGQDGAKIFQNTAAPSSKDNWTIEPWNGADGTTVTVTDLFYNTPVRAKFLKSASAEFSACLEVVQNFALSNPGVQFNLVHNGRESLRAFAADETSLGFEGALRVRAKQILGEELAKDLLYLEEDSRLGRLRGLVSPPGIEKAQSKNLHLFVNTRPVKDRLLRYGVLRGYQSHLLKGRFPVALLSLTIEPTLVDVNVHPAKTELRFQYADEVQGFIARAIRERLRRADWATPQGGALASEASSSSQAYARQGASSAGQVGTSSTFPYSSAGTLTSRSSPDPLPGAGGYAPPSRQTMRFDGNEIAPSKEWTSSSSRPTQLISSAADIDAFLSTPSSRLSPNFEPNHSFAPPNSQSAIPWRELRYLGTMAACYLLFEHDDRLLAIDQHAFHERVLFERLSNDSRLLAQSQKLLMPELVTLSPTAISALEKNRAELLRRGFDFTIQTAQDLEVIAVPTLLANRDLAAIFGELGRDLGEGEDDTDAYAGEDTAHEEFGQMRLLLATIACHAAVRAGELLSDDDRKLLLKEAETVDFYHNCPHGRRVFRWWNKSQIEAWFDR